jgi:hypothetical protein
MAVFSFLKFARSQWSTLPPVQHVDLSEHTVVVTGSNTGLGLEAVKYFARMKPKHLVLACRNRTKAEKAIASRRPLLALEHHAHTCVEVAAETGFLAELLILDMAEFASVSAFATAFEQKYDRLDILVCNAGVSVGSYSSSVDGWESMYVLESYCLNVHVLIKLQTPSKLSLHRSRVTPSTSDDGENCSGAQLEPAASVCVQLHPPRRGGRCGSSSCAFYAREDQQQRVHRVRLRKQSTFFHPERTLTGQ